MCLPVSNHPRKEGKSQKLRSFSHKLPITFSCSLLSSQGWIYRKSLQKQYTGTMLIRIFLSLSVVLVQGFVLGPFSSVRPSASLRLGADDDWYSDFEPTMFDPPNYRPPNPYEEEEEIVDGNGRRINTPSYDRGSSSERRPPRSAFPSNNNFRNVYTRDTSRDTSRVDVAAVEDLIAQRAQARKNRDFDLADNLRMQLLENYSVGVFDKDLTWRTGCSTSGSGMRVGAFKSSPKRREFGPNGHDYDLCPDAGPNTSNLNEDKIHELLADRLQAKMSRAFAEADRIQYVLIDAGVFVHDGRKEWRADGVPFGDLASPNGAGPGRTIDSHSDRNRPYQKSDDSLDADDEETIQAMVDKRVYYKQVRDYNNADRMRDELQRNFNIAIDDSTREWSVGGSFGKPCVFQTS
jgi:hypothetical protein